MTLPKNLYTPFPRQSLFHRSTAKYRLFGGAAGPGKTKALLWEGISQAHKVPGSDTLLLRRTYPELETSLLAQFRRDVPQILYKTFNESKHLVTWKNGSTTRFGFCLRKKDVLQYQGGEYLFIGFDELTHFELYQWQYLTSRNRCPVANSRPNMAGATNPGNIGHAWVKALWIDHKAPEGFDRPDMYDPREYEYIPSLLDDNPIYANDAAYRRTLETLPGQLREAFLHGNWDIYAGQYFSNWDEDKHVIAPSELVIQDWWPRWGSFDWGYGHDAVFQWHVQAGTLEDTDGKRRPLVVTYREMAKKGLSERALAEEIVARNNGDKLTNIYAGHDCWREDSNGLTKEREISSVLMAHGLPSLKRAKIDRVDGWRLCHRMLDEGEYLVTEDCPRLITAIPQRIHDEDNIEDVLKVDDAGDNDCDAWRYGLYTQFAPKELPFAQKMQQRTAHLTDLTERTIHIQKILADREREVRMRGQTASRSYGRGARWAPR